LAQNADKIILGSGITLCADSGELINENGRFLFIYRGDWPVTNGRGLNDDGQLFHNNVLRLLKILRFNPSFSSPNKEN
jgi:hypothetical protein